MTTPLIRSIMRHYDDPTEMHWFDATNCLKDKEQVDQNPLHYARPPFDKCVVVYEGKTSSGKPVQMTMLTAGDDPAEGIVLTCWNSTQGSKPTKVPPLVYIVEDGLLKYGPLNEDEVVTEAHAQNVLAFASAWYASMSRKCEAYLPVMKDTFTNQRKIKQGKLPAYDWRTVVVEPAAPRAENKGGTHAPPRLHDRRGHLRRLRSGKNVWVRPCKVGDAALGAVFHDYEIAARKGKT